MNSNLKLLPAALLVAMLALAGCGGGGGDDTMTPTDPTPPTPDPAALATAVDAASDAVAASEMASMLLEGALEASKALDAKSVNGSSQMAYDNAMKVLSAGAAIEAERAKAAAAVATAEGVDTTGMSAAEMARITNLINAAKGSLEEITDIQDAMGDGSLASAVMVVKATASVGDSDAMIAMSKAADVASAIKTAMGTTATPIAPAGTAANDAVMTTSHSGMTFMQIAGSNRMAVTMAGDITSDALGETKLTGGSGGTFAATALNAPQTSVFYDGIPGQLVCLSAACNADDDGKITGDVVFLPTDPTAVYVKKTYGGVYEAITNVASYGYWLDDSNAIIRHVSSKSPTGSVAWTHDDSEAGSPVKASYSGMAGGYSYRTVGEGDDKVDHSGEFTANVSLTASFTDTANEQGLEGSISGFAGGTHVNPNWYVNLGAGTITGASVTGTVGVGVSPNVATSGAWTATGYSTGTGASGADDENANPSGFVGSFNAGFTDGAAAGVYSATKN